MFACIIFLTLAMCFVFIYSFNAECRIPDFCGSHLGIEQQYLFMISEILSLS